MKGKKQNSKYNLLFKKKSLKNKKAKNLLNKKVYNRKRHLNKSRIKPFRLFSLFKILLLIIFVLLMIIKKYKKRKKLRIGVVGLSHEINVGNNLIKFAISLLLKKLGFIPYIIGTSWTSWSNTDISFINKTTNLIIVKKNFNELKREDFDILMVNSDQTWNRFGYDMLDYGYLKFAEKWNVKKFVYGASLGVNHWILNSREEKIAKELLKNFTGISIREQTSIDLVKSHFGITPEFVLDPTLLIDKKDYLDLVKNFPNNKTINGNYIFTYGLGRKKKKILNNLVLKASNVLNYKIYEYILNKKINPIEDFIYYIANCKAVLTNSFHGTIFSMIFNKPFITLCKNNDPRFQSLGNVFDLKNRLISYNVVTPDISLLTTPLNLNMTLIKTLKIKSINFIKKNLDLI